MRRGKLDESNTERVRKRDARPGKGSGCTEDAWAWNRGPRGEAAVGPRLVFSLLLGRVPVHVHHEGEVVASDRGPASAPEGVGVRGRVGQKGSRQGKEPAQPAFPSFLPTAQPILLFLTFLRHLYGGELCVC